MPDDPAEGFLSAATTPLADNAELHIAARQMLEGGMAGGDPVMIAAAAEQLEGAGSGRWRMALWVLAGVAVLAAVVFGYFDWSNYSGSSALGLKLPGASKREPTSEEVLGRRLNAEQRLLMFGDASRRTQPERLLALHESDPTNPAYYIDYVLAFRSEHKALPPDFLETGKRIDPGNAWFPAYAGGLLMEGTTEALPQTPAEKKAKAPRNYTVKDPTKVKEARELFHQAAQLPAFDLRQAELFRRRVELLPKRSAAFDHVAAAAYVASTRAGSLPVRELGRLVNVESARLGTENDREGMRELIADWDAFMAKYVASTDTFILDVLVKTAVVRGGYRDLAKAASKLGLEEDAKRLQAVSDRFEAYYEKRRAAHEARLAENEYMGHEMSILGSLSLPVADKQVLHPPELRSRLGPSRWTEHEFALKFCTLLLLCPALLLIGLCLALFRFRGGELRRKLSAQLVRMLRARDWMLLLGTGVLLPFVLFQVVARLPWTGGREWGVSSLKFLVPTVALNLTGWLMVILSVAIARRCLQKRLGFLGLRWRFAWVAWSLSFLLVVAIPLAGQAFLPWQPNSLMPVVYTIFMTTLAWVLVAACRGLFSRSENLLKRMVLCRVLMPGVALAVILAVLSLPLAHHLESYWAQRDELNEITPEAPALSRYEYEITGIAHRELLEVLQLPAR